MLLNGTVKASILFEIFESSLKSTIEPPTESSFVFSLFFPMDCKLTAYDGRPGPGRKLKFTKKVFVFNGLTVVLKILLSKCLNPKLINNLFFKKLARSDTVNWRVLFLRNGFPKETYSGPT